MIGSQDLLVGLAIALFFCGAKRLPEIARSLGTAMKEFSKGVSGNAAMTNNQASAAACLGTTGQTARDKSTRQRNGHHHRGEQDHLDVDVLNPWAVKRQERRPEPPR